ncbi:ECF transporter S component [Carnobacterium pleistocenium]|uniref:ECF transporter S component n=1 Tax=Carnobacterium pleistocenium TaxID=181073 RepID=UPI000557F449|nr:ECF transporter S component [Carnobacterium pleistocenium]
MEKISTKKIVTIALFMAMTIVMTIVIRIPTFRGYINLGDMVLLFAALFLGKKAGFLIGGLGSALADIIVGYAFYAPITFVVKGLQGYICGWIFQKTGYHKPLLATIPAGLFMAFGYFVAESFMYGLAGAAVSIPGNLLQGIVGALGAVLLEKSVGTKIKR